MQSQACTIEVHLKLEVNVYITTMTFHPNLSPMPLSEYSEGTQNVNNCKSYRIRRISSVSCFIISFLNIR